MVIRKQRPVDDPVYTVPLMPEDLEPMMRNVKGPGGRQDLRRILKRSLRTRADGTYEFTISQFDLDRCVRYYFSTEGDGGDQGCYPMQSLADAGLIPNDRTYRAKATLPLF